MLEQSIVKVAMDGRGVLGRRGFLRAVGLGAAGVLILCGFLLDHFHDWRIAFFVPAAMAVACAALLFLYLRDTPESVGLPEVAGTATAGSKVSAKVEDGHVDFLAGDELVGRYHTDPKFAKPIFWPVHAPGNVPLTRNWPMDKSDPKEATDHIHQKSVWFTYGDMRLGQGRENAKQYLEEHPEVMDEIEGRVRATMANGASVPIAVGVTSGNGRIDEDEEDV